MQIKFFLFSFFRSSFLSPVSFYLTIVGAEDYCYMWSHTMTRAQSAGLLWLSDRPVTKAYTSNYTQDSQKTGIYAPGRIRTRNSSKKATEILVSERSATATDT